MLTARAIIIWLSSQNVYQLKNGIGNQDTPEGFLILLGKNKTTYSTFFTVLCRYVKTCKLDLTDNSENTIDISILSK